MCREKEERQGRLQDSKQKNRTLRISYEGGNAFNMFVIRPQGCAQCFEETQNVKQKLCLLQVQVGQH